MQVQITWSGNHCRVTEDNGVVLPFAYQAWVFLKMEYKECKTVW